MKDVPLLAFTASVFNEENKNVRKCGYFEDVIFKPATTWAAVNTCRILNDRKRCQGNDTKIKYLHALRERGSEADKTTAHITFPPHRRIPIVRKFLPFGLANTIVGSGKTPRQPEIRKKPSAPSGDVGLYWLPGKKVHFP